jgi:PAS domain S-box-containing protein
LEDENKTKEQLIEKLMELRQRIAKLEVYEEEYRHAKEQMQIFNRIVLQMKDAVILTDKDQRIRYVNEAFNSTYGYTRDEIISKPSSILFVGSDEEFKLWMQKAFNAIARDGEFRVEYRNRRKDGSIFWVSNTISLVSIGDEMELYWLGIIRDITEHKGVEDELRESYRLLEKALDELKVTQNREVQHERLLALGQLASGVAHDFNNALTPILGYSELMLKVPGSLDDKESVRKYLEMIETAAKDAGEVVNRLREFYRSREEDEEFIPVNINQLIQQAIQLTQPRWKDQAQVNGININISTDLQNVPQVNGKEAELRELIINLILNAVDAMPTSGSISLRTHASGTNVIFEVSDAGVGMTEETRKRCFEPFFTTKGDRGTGLGLSVVYGIVKRHDGAIEVESEVGKGTNFIIQFPIAKKEYKEEKVKKVEKSLRSLHILVVEDELLIREILGKFLSIDKHTFKMASNGREGMEIFEKDNFDLVITDRAMPDIGGDQLSAFIKQINPKIPIIMVTGFGSTMDASSKVLKNVDYLLGKPLTLEKFQGALSAVSEKIENALNEVPDESSN